MAKVTYTFDTFEDREELEIHQRAISLQSACSEFADWMRGQVKHGEADVMEDRLDTIGKCQEKFWELVSEHWTV